MIITTRDAPQNAEIMQYIGIVYAYALDVSSGNRGSMQTKFTTDVSGDFLPGKTRKRNG
jgi:hypothetical protein